MMRRWDIGVVVAVCAIGISVAMLVWVGVGLFDSNAPSRTDVDTLRIAVPAETVHVAIPSTPDTVVVATPCDPEMVWIEVFGRHGAPFSGVTVP